MFIYNLLIYILSPIIIIKILYNSLQRSNDSNFVKQRLGLLSFEKNKDSIWLHASSIGETKIALKLLQIFRERGLKDKIVITTTTKSSKAILDKSNENFQHY